MANFIVNPMVRGICAGDSREISAAAFIMGPLYREEMLSTCEMKNRVTYRIGQ